MDKMANERGSPAVPPTVMEIIASEGRGDSRFLRWAVGLALVAHVVLFAVHWPSFARAAVEAEETEPRVYELTDVVYPPPPPPKVTIEVPSSGPPVISRPVELQEPEFRVESPEVFDFQVVIPDDVDWFVVPPDPEPEPPKIWDPVTMTRPIQVYGPSPEYPPMASRCGYGGVVILECTIDTQGTVRVNKVLRGQPLGLTEAAVAAAEQWRFEPATFRGRPVDVIYVLTVRFTAERV